MGVWKLLIRSLMRKRLRTSLTMLSIALAFAVFGVLGAFQLAVGGGRDRGSGRMITLNSINFTRTLPYSTFQTIVGRDDVAQATHVNWFGGYVGEPRDQLATLAVDPASYLALYSDVLTIPSDQADTFVHRRSGAIVGEAAARRWGWKVGDKIRLSSSIFRRSDHATNWDFELVGIFNAPSGGIDTEFALINYDAFNEAKEVGRDRINYVISRPARGIDQDSFGKSIDALFAGSPEPTSTDSERAFSQAFLAQFGNVALITSLVVGAAFFVTLLVVGTTLLISLRERTREIGIMMTLGFPRHWIFGLILGESIFMSIVSGLAGLALAYLGLEWARSVLAGLRLRLDLTASLAMVGAVLMVTLGVVTGGLPAWRASRMSIVDALKER